jgi:hypothetical protein
MKSFLRMAKPMKGVLAVGAAWSVKHSLIGWLSPKACAGSTWVAATAHRGSNRALHPCLGERHRSIGGYAQLRAHTVPHQTGGVSLGTGISSQ